MYDSGLGVEHVNRFLSGLIIPVPNPNLMKNNCEREDIPHIQSHIQSIAEDSSQQALLSKIEKSV